MPAKQSAVIDTRVIYCGDNLDQLRKLPESSVDLIYIDPPFNSNRIVGQPLPVAAIERGRRERLPYKSGARRKRSAASPTATNRRCLTRSPCHSAAKTCMIHNGARNYFLRKRFWRQAGRGVSRQFRVCSARETNAEVWICSRTLPVVPAKFWHKLSDQKLWEVRAEYAGNIYRILATTAKGNRVILLHGFQKKSQKTPRQDMEIAQQRQKRYFQRHGYL